MIKKKRTFAGLLLSCVAFSLFGCKEISSLSSASITSEVSEDLPTETIKDGAYLITSESWETYVRSWAQSIEHLLGEVTEDFIQKAINESLTVEDVDGLYLYPPSRKAMWVVVSGENLTLSLVERKLYSFALVGEAYQAEAWRSTIEFKLNGDNLKLEINDYVDYKLEYFYDDAYVFIEEPVQLAKPEIDDYSVGGEGLNFVFLQWGYESSYGSFGAGIEVKKADETAFSLVKIEYPYLNLFTVQLTPNDFSVGTNFLRVRNLGGATIMYGSPRIGTYLDSDYVTFSVDSSVGIEKQ